MEEDFVYDQPVGRPEVVEELLGPVGVVVLVVGEENQLIVIRTLFLKGLVCIILTFEQSMTAHYLNTIVLAFYLPSWTNQCKVFTHKIEVSSSCFNSVLGPQCLVRHI